MKVGDWVIWNDLPGEVHTVYNDGLNLVVKVPYSDSPYAVRGASHSPKLELITVDTKDCHLITKEVADIMKADL